MVSIGDQTEWVEKNLEELRYKYDLLPGDKVLDIGSYQRQFANEIVKRYGCEVECFDALDNRAAWLYDGSLQMGGAYYYTSMFITNPYSTYKCVDIARYLNEEIALVKINIEGGEYKLLDYIIDTGLVKNIKNIQVQFHLIEGMKCDEMYFDISQRLKQTHRLTWRYPFVWENWKRNEHE